MRASLILALLLVACDGAATDTGGTATSTGSATSTTTATSTGSSTGTGTSTGSGTGSATDTATATATDTASDTATATDTTLADGAAVYARGCAASNCHGANGDSGSGPNLSSEVPDRSDSSLSRIIRDGTGSMPAVTVTDEELADLLAYLRATFP